MCVGGGGQTNRQMNRKSRQFKSSMRTLYQKRTNRKKYLITIGVTPTEIQPETQLLGWGWGLKKKKLISAVCVP